MLLYDYLKKNEKKMETFHYEKSIKDTKYETLSTTGYVEGMFTLKGNQSDLEKLKRYLLKDNEEETESFLNQINKKEIFISPFIHMVDMDNEETIIKTNEGYNIRVNISCPPETLFNIIHGKDSQYENSKQISLKEFCLKEQLNIALTFYFEHPFSDFGDFGNIKIDLYNNGEYKLTGNMDLSNYDDLESLIALDVFLSDYRKIDQKALLVKLVNKTTKGM